jgi:ABC-2 type transport system permease protein
MKLLWTFLWKEALVLREDPTFIFFLFLFPILLTALLADAIGAMPGVKSGVDQAIPGFTVMFGFYVMLYSGVSHYREHSWGAWTVVRSSGLSRLALLSGVVGPYFLLGVLQMVVMFAIGRLLFGAHLNGSLPGLALMILVTQFAIVGIGVTLLNVTSHYAALLNLTQLAVLGFGALGGALVPISLMPEWSRFLGHGTPQFWALQGLQDVTSRGKGLADIAPNIAILLAMGAVLVLAGFRAFEPAKERSAVL